MSGISLSCNGQSLNISSLPSGIVISDDGNTSSISTIDSTSIYLGNDIKNTLTSVTTISSKVTDVSNSLTTVTSKVTDISNSVTTLNSTVSDLSNVVHSAITLDQTILPVTNMSTTPMLQFAEEWRQCANAGTSNIIDMCCSGDGRVSFVCPWSFGNAQLSLDYGATWATPSGLSSSIWSAAMSLDGKYIVVLDSSNFFKSSDYGSNFSFIYYAPSYVQGIAISATGKYMVCGCSYYQGLNVSSDYGNSWTKTETSTWLWTSVATAIDGSVMYGASDGGIIKKTTNYGSSWSTVYTDASSNSIKRIKCSGDGQYVLVCFSSSAKLLLSTNYGATFSQVGSTASYYNISVSTNSVYMIASVNGSGLYYSVDRGTSWTFLSNNQFCAVAMSYNGDTIYNVSAYNKPIVCRMTSPPLNTTAPLIPSIGSTYFDTSGNRLYVYNGSDWKYAALV